MANFPIFHGITLAANAYIENLNLEILTADPVPVGPGRVWFNSTAKAIKYSGLDATGAVIVRTIKDAESAAAELAQLTSDYQAADTAEAAARVSGDASTLADAKTYTDTAKAQSLAYADAIKAEILGGIPPEVLDTITELATALQNNPDIIDLLGTQIGGVQTNLDAEVTRATAAEAQLSTDIATAVSDAAAALADEVARATAAEVALDTRVTTVEGQVNGKIGLLSSLTTDDKTNLVAAINEVDANADTAQSTADAAAASVVAEASTARAAEAALGVRVDDEIARATAAEADLAAAVSAEATRATAAEGVLTTNLAAEVTRATAAEAALGVRVDDEVARATAAEGVLTTNLAAEVTRATAAEGVLTTNLAAEVTRATAAEAAIKSSYNGTVHTYQSSTAATVHTVVHNLNNGFVDVGIQVERSNGKYYNDIVSVEEVDTNTVKVYLSTALKIKAICRSAVTL